MKIMKIFIYINKEGVLINAENIPISKHSDGTYSSGTNHRCKSVAEVVVRIQDLLKNVLPEN